MGYNLLGETKKLIRLKGLLEGVYFILFFEQVVVIVFFFFGVDD